MPSTTMKSPFSHVESAAVDAAMKRARTGQPVPLGPDPAVLSAQDELAGVARVLRHRLRLDSHNRPVVIRAAHDSVHPLFVGGTHYRAVALSIAFADRSLNFLATYDDLRRLTFDIVALCPLCHEPVPTEEINSSEDLGDYILQARDALGGSRGFPRERGHRVLCGRGQGN
ncbi:hypothetical protein OG369_43090 [Streptomyces sp. NBC_01221]|uniref:hypothetical protein n=1 Tax=Streptomyces sp. NBC_01221 TaxID=2903782 RepID=UPI00224D2AF6|nr:hypothetical protein [Streptomyces sp. NBC_01221]MCX4792024.1 hypothetical protein [Streptomyces sp. NBC_01221]MCX4792564.1 hypothetical protein [Streptomyces sp. NBC_01221]